MQAYLIKSGRVKKGGREMKNELVVSAGGKNVRIKEYLARSFSGIPKHILPLPVKGTTVIQSIVEQAKSCFSRIVISANSENSKFFSLIFRSDVDVKVQIDTECNGPLGPMLRNLLEQKKRMFGCAGDFFCDFHWKKFLDFHNQHDRPVSILVAKSVPGISGARFVLKEDMVVSWERVPIVGSEDLINIGCYIIDPNREVVEMVSEMKMYKEDTFFNQLIPYGYVCAYKSDSRGFNINTPVVYEALCEELHGR